jgi:FixJ family two-component response regulator
MSELKQAVFVVDDAPEVRVALSRLLGAAGYTVHLFDSAEQFLAEQNSEDAGCLLLDMAMPGLNGLELQSALNSSGCGRPIVFLTGHGDMQAGVNAMKRGAVDFLAKPVDETRLFAALDHALNIDDTARSSRATCRAIEQRLETLTPRELQVMEEVICGRLNKQIAGKLSIREKTVKVHRARVMSKMHVRSVAELVQIAFRVGISAPLSGSAPERNSLRHRTAIQDDLTGMS